MAFKDPEKQKEYDRKKSAARRATPEYRQYKKDYYKTNSTKLKAQIAASRVKRRVSLREFLDDLKNHPCVDCGNTFPPECMDFDHIPERGEKLFNIGETWGGSYSKKRILAEVEKCELVCSNCHRMRTRQRGQHNIGV
jgi:hypothetical protein